MKAGDKAYLPYGRYKYTETIRIENASSGLKNCVIVLDGVYAQPKTSTFDAMTVAGENPVVDGEQHHQQLPEQYLSHQAGFRDYRHEGAELHLHLWPDHRFRIRHPPYALQGEHRGQHRILPVSRRLQVSAVSGSRSRRERFGQQDGLYRRAGAGLHWCDYEKGSAQTSPHTGNTFNTISWESIETTGIDAAYAANTTHIAARALSQSWG